MTLKKKKKLTTTLTSWKAPWTCVHKGVMQGEADLGSTCKWSLKLSNLQEDEERFGALLQLQRKGTTLPPAGLATQATRDKSEGREANGPLTVLVLRFCEAVIATKSRRGQIYDHEDQNSVTLTSLFGSWQDQPGDTTDKWHEKCHLLWDSHLSDELHLVLLRICSSKHI